MDKITSENKQKNAPKNNAPHSRCSLPTLLVFSFTRHYHKPPTLLLLEAREDGKGKIVGSGDSSSTCSGVRAGDYSKNATRNDVGAYQCVFAICVT